MLLPFLLKQHRTWKKCKLRIFTVAQVSSSIISISTITATISIFTDNIMSNTVIIIDNSIIPNNHVLTFMLRLKITQYK